MHDKKPLGSVIRNVYNRKIAKQSELCYARFAVIPLAVEETIVPGILGVDPGVSGAIALYQPLMSDSRNQWVIQDLPEHGADLRETIQRWTPNVAFLELTFHNKAGSHASFKLGERTGWVLGILECCGVPVVRAQPAAWKRALGLLKTKKRDSLELAREFVGPIPELSLMKHHNRAEAVLIAYYGAIKYGRLV